MTGHSALHEFSVGMYPPGWSDYFKICTKQYRYDNSNNNSKVLKELYDTLRYRSTVSKRSYDELTREQRYVLELSEHIYLECTDYQKTLFVKHDIYVLMCLYRIGDQEQRMRLNYFWKPVFDTPEQEALWQLTQ